MNVGREKVSTVWDHFFGRCLPINIVYIRLTSQWNELRSSFFLTPLPLQTFTRAHASPLQTKVQYREYDVTRFELSVRGSFSFSMPRAIPITILQRFHIFPILLFPDRSRSGESLVENTRPRAQQIPQC